MHHSVVPTRAVASRHASVQTHVLEPATSATLVPGRRWARTAGAAFAFATLVVLWFAPLDVDPRAQRAIAIAGGLVVLWATEPIAHATAAAIGLLAFWVAGTSAWPVLASGFLNESVWFLFGALVIGTMASQTGLAKRLAYSVATRAGGSYSRLLLAFIVTDFALTFFVPSGIARVTILAAIVAGLVQALGLSPRSNAARGLLIVVTYTAGIFDKMILAGAASILAHGIIDRVGGVRLSYATWFVAYLPGDVLTIVACWLAILWLYPASDELAGSGTYLARELDRLGPWTDRQRRAAVLLGSAVALWMTDALHGVRPVTVAMGIAVLALVPGIGVLRLADLRAMRTGTIIFTAAAISMTAVLADTHGLDLLTTAMVGWLTPLVEEPVSMSVALYWTAFVYHFFLGSESSMLSATLPAVLNFANAQGLSPVTVGLVWTFGSGGKIFAYQSAVLMVGYAYGYFDAKDLLRVGLLLTVVESLILLLLVPFYWPLIGIQ
jgi:solute carrier family 13 (sodium-dependent dicarboxylate transporter), member 2/3/5